MVFRNPTTKQLKKSCGLLCLVVLSAAAGAYAGAAVGATESSHVELSSTVLRQGDTLKVLVTPPAGTVPPSLTFNRRTFKLFPLSPAVSSDGAAAVSYRALIGIPADLDPNNYKLGIGDVTKDITVKDGDFVLQKMRLPKGKDNFIASPGEEDAVKKAKETVSSGQMWSGKFQRPSQARTSTGFGQKRIVNGLLLKDYFHSGLDFAGGSGSPATAAQSGRVILARTGWKLHGNTVAIDHGQGVITFYIHLSKINVTEGSVVKVGQEIGKIGMTGRANGPHLHFSLYVNGDATNPLNWFHTSF